MNNEELTKDIEQTINSAKKLALSMKERSIIRERLSNYMYSTKVPVKTTHSFYSIFNTKSMYLMPAFAILLIVSGAGTSYYAQGSLPGDTLYSVKTGFNENIESLLATSPEAKAQVDLRQVSERLDEAEVLRITGNLTDVKSQVIQNNVSKKIDSINKKVEESKKKGKEEVAVKTSNELEEEVDEHYDVFVSISNSASNSPTFSKLLKTQDDTQARFSNTMSMKTAIPEVPDKNLNVMAMTAMAAPEVPTLDVLVDVKIATYKLKEVRKHKKATDCWTVVSGNVYDITPLIKKYPVGASLLKSMCGIDSTKKFNMENKEGVMSDQIEEYKIGELE